VQPQSKSKILLIEDDPVLGRGLCVNLELEGYALRWEKNLSSALSLIKSGSIEQMGLIDLVILDLGLPDGSGLRFLKELRAVSDSKTAQLPVVILTAKTDEDSVVEGLQSGANDYVRKPFGNRELLVRIQLLLKAPSAKESKIHYSELTASIDERKIWWTDKEIPLNRREFDILCHMIQNAEKVVTRDSLLHTLDKDGEIFDRTIDSHVSHVRSRLRQAGVEAVQISPVYGVGYRLEKTERS
jgi:DNA-binding response OmpR family regulator